MECEERRMLLQSIVNDSPAQYESRLQELKEIARKYHFVPARSILDEAIIAAQRLNSVSDEEIEVFNESFITVKDGLRRISERHYMCPRTVSRIQARVFGKLMPFVFGIDGILFE